MVSPSSVAPFNEAYELAGTVDVVARLQEQDRRVRIEAFLDLHGGGYSTRYYIAEDFTVQPTYPQGQSGFSRAPESHEVWVSVEMPWVKENTANAALERALGWIAERQQAETTLSV